MKSSSFCIFQIIRIFLKQNFYKHFSENNQSNRPLICDIGSVGP